MTGMQAPRPDPPRYGGVSIKWRAMSLETARAFFTYLTALIVVIGGFMVIYFTHEDVTASDLRVIMAGFIGAALQFLFGAQVASQATTAKTNGSPPKPVSGP